MTIVKFQNIGFYLLFLTDNCKQELLLGKIGTAGHADERLASLYTFYWRS